MVLVSSGLNCWSCSWCTKPRPRKWQLMQVVNNLQAQDSAGARKCSEAAGDESDKNKGKAALDRGDEVTISGRWSGRKDMLVVMRERERKREREREREREKAEREGMERVYLAHACWTFWDRFSR